MALLNTLANVYVPPATITTVLREDLYKVVAIVDPDETPAVNLARGGQTGSPVYQWGADALPPLVKTNSAGSIDVLGINTQGLTEDADPQFQTNFPYSATNPRRLTNFVQLFGAKIGVSDFLRRATTNLIDDPYTHEQIKAAKAVGLAVEARWFDNPSANASYRAATHSDPNGRAMRTFHEFTVATGAGAQATDPVFNQVTAAGLITTTLVDQCMEAVVTNTSGMPKYLFVSPGVKLDFTNSARTNNATVGPINYATISAAEKRVIKQVDFYWGEYGPLAVVMCRQIPQSSATSGGGRAWLLDFQKIADVMYWPLQHIPLAKTGPSTKGMLIGARTLEITHAAAMGFINQVTT